MSFFQELCGDYDGAHAMRFSHWKNRNPKVRLIYELVKLTGLVDEHSDKEILRALVDSHNFGHTMQIELIYGDDVGILHIHRSGAQKADGVAWDITEKNVRWDPADFEWDKEFINFLGMVFVCEPGVAILVERGVSHKRRRAMWQEDNAVRRRLARFLVDQPGVLINMSRELMVPWKGMILFHGSEIENIQGKHIMRHETGQDEAELVPDIPPNQVGRSQLHAPAFTTPYISKAANYTRRNGRIYTYRLDVEGPSLRLLDGRTDYHEPFLGHEVFDPLRVLEDYAGIPNDHKKNRNPKVRLIYELFKDTGLADGIVLNNDCEWIWFKAADVLKWVPPEDTVPQSPGAPLTTKDIVHAGWNTTHKIEVALYDCASMWSHSITMQALREFLTGRHLTRKRISELPHYRWAVPHDTSLRGAVDPDYANQYMMVGIADAGPGPHWAGPGPHWTETKLGDELLEVHDLDDPEAPPKSQLLDVYEVDYRELWTAICPAALNIYMGNSSTEGGGSSNTSPYHYLIKALHELSQRQRARSLEPARAAARARQDELRQQIEARRNGDEPWLTGTGDQSRVRPRESEEQRAVKTEWLINQRKAAYLGALDTQPQIQLLVKLPTGRVQLMPPMGARLHQSNMDTNGAIVALRVSQRAAAAATATSSSSSQSSAKKARTTGGKMTQLCVC